jgi:phospholipase/lecithinase/hemolysin
MANAVTFSVLLMALAVAGGAAASRFNSILALGDSLLDNGNDFRATNGLVPNNSYYGSNGRFTNGPVWGERLDSRLSGLYRSKVPFIDAAWGGAHVLAAGLVPTLPQQVFALVTNTTPPGFLSRSLVIISVGGNDLNDAITAFLNSTQSAADKAQLAKTEAEIVSGIKAALRVLLSPQYRASAIVIQNAAPLELVPVYALLKGPAAAAVAKQVANSYNAALQAMVSQLVAATKGARVKVHDVHKLLLNVIAHPKTYGFTNVKDPCLIFDFTKPLAFAPFFIPIGRCKNPEGYVAWDILHPTAHAHRVIGDDAYALIRNWA